MASRLIFAVVLTIRLLTAGEARQADEYTVKAVYLYNFTKFVEWPPEIFADSKEPIVVCVLGEDPFGRALDDAVQDKVIQGRPLVVRRVSDRRKTKGCRVLFVGSSQNKSLLAVLASAGERGVLTVGEVDNPTTEGMIINFILDGGKVRFTINTAAAARENLRISSRLLSLAVTVTK